MRGENSGNGFSAPALSAEGSHNLAMSMDLSDVVSGLVELLGATDVAALGGVQETRAVQQWINGAREPQRAHTLRFALQLSLMISTLATRDLVRAWFHGSNPALDDATPLALLRDRPLEVVQAPLMIAARSFAAREAGAQRSSVTHGNHTGESTQDPRLFMTGKSSTIVPNTVLSGD